MASTRFGAGSTAHVDFLQENGISLKVSDLLLEIVGECGEFLPGCHRHCILELGASHLDYGIEFHAFGAQGGNQLLEGCLQFAVHPDEGVTEGGGIGVVGTLGAVHVVVGGAVLVLALLVTEKFEGAVGDDFVGVHVHGSAGTSLHHVHRELVVELAFGNFLRSLADSISDFRVERAEFLVGKGGRPLYVADGRHVIREVFHVVYRDLVIVDGSLSLYAVVGVKRNLELTEKVRLCPEFFFLHGWNCVIVWLSVL